MDIKKLVEEYNILETVKTLECEIDNIFDAKQILYGELDKEYWNTLEKNILEKAYNLLAERYQQWNEE